VNGDPLGAIDPLGLVPGGANYYDITISQNAWNDGYGGIQLFDVVSPRLDELENVVALPPKPAEGEYQYVPYVQMQNGVPVVLYYTAYEPFTHATEWVISPEQLSFFEPNQEYFHNYAASFMRPTGYQLGIARMEYDLMIGDYSSAANHCAASWGDALSSREWWLGSLISFSGGVMTRNLPRIAQTKPAKYVYDASAKRYRNLTTGKFVNERDIPWPDNAGFASSTRQTIQPGTILDRYGSPSGRFLGEPGATVSERGMAQGSEYMQYTQYRVIKPFDAQVGPAAAVPEFGASGGATQYLPVTTVEQLVQDGYLEVIL